MTTMRFDDIRQYSDVLRSRSGEAVTVRFVEPRDGEALQNYFRALTTRSRYNRFLGATSELPASLLEQFIHIGAHSFIAGASLGHNVDRLDNQQRRGNGPGDEGREVGHDGLPVSKRPERGELGNDEQDSGANGEGRLRNMQC